MRTAAVTAGAPLVLVVEDDGMLRSYLRELLEGEGYRVALAANGREGVARARALGPALVLTDLLMPELDGIDLIRLLREDTSPPEIVAMSGAGRVHGETWLAIAARLGATQVLEKPLDTAKLLAAIGALVHAPGPG